MRKKLLIGTIIFLLLLGTIGFTYSIFSIPFTGEGKINTVTAGTLQIQYIDGTGVSMSNAYPGQSITKVVSVKNTGTLDAEYNLIYKNLINEIENGELVVSYTCTSYTGYVSSTNKGTVSGTCNGLSNKVVPYSTYATNIPITSKISIASSITHEYTFTFTFKEMNAAQNYNQGKRFSTKINISEVTPPDLEIASITVNGKEDAQPSSGNYYLTGYSCNNGAEIRLDEDTNYFRIYNYTKGTSCTAELETEPLLVDMPLGSYVSYTGTNGCPTTEVEGEGEAQSKDACSGKNANQNADTSNYTYGYCYNADYKFYTYGWRLAYTLDSDSDGTKEAYIVTAGSPECVKGTSNDSTSTIASLNAAAIKYCNEALAYGGTCQSTYNASNANTWAMNGKDYYNITNQWYGEGRRLYSYDTATENSSGTVCYNVQSTKQCGYNSDIIDNGGTYWFGSAECSSCTLYWYPVSRLVNFNSRTNAYGARPVVHLKSTVRVKGGSGTMDDPYIIG